MARAMKRRLSTPPADNQDKQCAEESVTDEQQQQHVETSKKIQVLVKASQSKQEEEIGYLDKHEVFFNIEMDLPLKWVMVVYCDKMHMDFNMTRFEYNGAKLRDMDTPHQLGMLDNDVIYAFYQLTLPGDYKNSAVHFVTICIRMHKEKDIFCRVKRSATILPQLIRCFPDGQSRESGSLHFVYGGLKLHKEHTADELYMVEGDVIDGFNFSANCSSLSIISPHLTLKLKNVVGEGPEITVTQNTHLGWVMDRYIELEYPTMKTEREGFRFICRRVLSAERTVEEEQLKDGDTIRVELSVGPRR